MSGARFWPLLLSLNCKRPHSLTTSIEDNSQQTSGDDFLVVFVILEDTDRCGCQSSRTAFSTSSIAKVLAACCQQPEPTESESEGGEAASTFYQCLLKPTATSRLVLLAGVTHTGLCDLLSICLMTTQEVRAVSYTCIGRPSEEESKSLGEVFSGYNAEVPRCTSGDTVERPESRRCPRSWLLIDELFWEVTILGFFTL